MNKSNIINKTFPILDKGFIKVKDYLGTDVTAVNSARVSFGKEKNKFDKNDRKLVKYLIKYKHFSPFRHNHIIFHIKAPEFVMRQWYKHVVGIETTSSYCTKDHAWNEISGRYVPVNDYYFPSIYRKQSKDNKQASEGCIENQELCKEIFENAIKKQIESYEKLLQLGVAKEQARIMLPLNQYTEIYWTASYQAVQNFIELREEKTSQYEIQEYAKTMKKIMRIVYPEISQIWENVNQE